MHKKSYIRFVVGHAKTDFGALEGVFQAAFKLLAKDELSLSDRKILRSLLKWFDRNLATPARFNRTRSKGFYRRRTAGIAWFKDSATEHIANARGIIEILENHEYVVSMITESRLGYVVFEDDYQVVAEPFRDTRTQKFLIRHRTIEPTTVVPLCWGDRNHQSL